VISLALLIFLATAFYLGGALSLPLIEVTLAILPTILAAILLLLHLLKDGVSPKVLCLQDLSHSQFFLIIQRLEV